MRRNRSAWGGYPGEGVGPVTIALTTRDLRNAAVVGSGSLEIDRARGLRVDLSVSGSGRLSVGAVEADNLVVGLLGGGRITLAGRAKQLKATIQGSGDLAAAGLSADDAQIASDTAGNVALAVADTAKVTATGSGESRSSAARPAPSRRRAPARCSAAENVRRQVYAAARLGSGMDRPISCAASTQQAIAS